jgi:hypothetical protein
VIKSHPELKDWIWDQTPFVINTEPNSVRERVFCIINNITEVQTCGNCNKPTVFVNGYYQPYCSRKCGNSCVDKLEGMKFTILNKTDDEKERIKEKSKQTILNKSDSEMQRIKEKAKLTNLNKTTEEKEKIREKAKQTSLTRHGVEHYTNKEKMKDTNLERYGVEYPSQSKEIQLKIQQTNTERYGVCYPLECPDILEKTRNSLMISYGVCFPGNAITIQDKTKTTMIKNHGVANPAQSQKLRAKWKRNNAIKRGVEYPTQHHIIDILPLLNDKEFMTDEYINKEKSAHQIAHEFGIVYYGTIIKYLRIHEIEIRLTEKSSHKSNLWITSEAEKHGIVIQQSPNEYHITGTRYRADGYCRETNTIYEFYGDYWHGNPDVYEPEFYNKSLGKVMREIYQDTIIRENKIKSLGYNLITMWECDFK